MLILALIDVIAKKQGIGPGLGFSCCLDVSLDLRGGSHTVFCMCALLASHISWLGLLVTAAAELRLTGDDEKDGFKKCGKYKKNIAR